MPIERGIDKNGPFYKIHNVNNKYYYISKNKLSREKAYNKALTQLKAIQINKRYR